MQVFFQLLYIRRINMENKITKLCIALLILFIASFLASSENIAWSQYSEETPTVSSDTDVDIYSNKGFGVSVSISRPEYWTDFMPPGWRPPVIPMRIQVYNHSRIPVRFHFTTSQRYDFSIYNSRGYEVWRWSDDKAFLQVQGEIILNPGESVTYTTSIKFVDKNGEAMPVDLYTLKGELTAVDLSRNLPRVMQGIVSFDHMYVY
jgi:hypothetical protein